MAPLVLVYDGNNPNGTIVHDQQWINDSVDFHSFSEGPTQYNKSTEMSTTSSFLTSQAQWQMKCKYRQEIRNAEAELERMKECRFRPERRNRDKNVDPQKVVERLSVSNSTRRSTTKGSTTSGTSGYVVKTIDYDNPLNSSSIRVERPEKAVGFTEAEIPRYDHGTIETRAQFRPQNGEQRRHNQNQSLQQFHPYPEPNGNAHGKIQAGSNSFSKVQQDQKTQLYHQEENIQPYQEAQGPRQRKNFAHEESFNADNSSLAMSINDIRREKAEEWRREQEQSELAECTFKPDIRDSQSSYRCYRPFLQKGTNDTTLSMNDGASYTSTSLCGNRDHTLAITQREMDRELTFRPQTNQVPDHMVAARSYTSKDVFERLSAPTTGSADDLKELKDGKEGRKDRNNDTASASDGPRKNDYGAYQLANAYASYGPNYGAPSDISTNDVNSQSKNVGNMDFILRQCAFEEARQSRLEVLERQYEYTHAPTLCPKSRKMVAQKQMRESQGEPDSRFSNESAQQRQRSAFCGRDLTFDGIKNAFGASTYSNSSSASIPAKSSYLRPQTSNGLSYLRPYESSSVVSRDETANKNHNSNGIENNMNYSNISRQLDVSGKLSRIDEDAELIGDYTAPNCTFRPQILRKSKLLQARSLEEMSYGDRKRKDEKVREIKQKLEFEEDMRVEQSRYERPLLRAHAGFDEITSKTQAYRSFYVEKLREKQQEKEMERKKEFVRRDEEELQECRFQPKLETAGYFAKKKGNPKYHSKDEKIHGAAPRTRPPPLRGMISTTQPSSGHISNLGTANGTLNGIMNDAQANTGMLNNTGTMNGSVANRTSNTAAINNAGVKSNSIEMSNSGVGLMKPGASTADVGGGGGSQRDIGDGSLVVLGTSSTQGQTSGQGISRKDVHLQHPILPPRRDGDTRVAVY